MVIGCLFDWCWSPSGETPCASLMATARSRDWWRNLFQQLRNKRFFSAWFLSSWHSFVNQMNRGHKMGFHPLISFAWRHVSGHVPLTPFVRSELSLFQQGPRDRRNRKGPSPEIVFMPPDHRTPVIKTYRIAHKSHQVLLPSTWWHSINFTSVEKMEEERQW